MPDAKIKWAASHFDFFVGGDSTLLATYKALTDAPFMLYDNFYCLYVGGHKYNEMVQYAKAHGYDAEKMFIHFAETTTVTFADGTYTLPAGSRVPTYGWYRTDGDLTKVNARVMMNPGSAEYREFNTYYENLQLEAMYGNTTYDGLFVDNSAGGGISATTGKIVSGGSTVEYSGSGAKTDAAYDADMVKVFAEVRNSLGHKGGGNKLQVANNANRPDWTDLFPYVDGLFREYLIQPSRQNADGLSNEIQLIQKSSASGVFSVVSEIGMGETSIDQPRNKLTGLAAYYILSTPLSYFNRQDCNSCDLENHAWFPAIEYDIGLPKGAYTVLATGIDPSSPKSDSGSGTVICSNEICTLTDVTKNWPTDHWKGANFIDTANHVFGGVWHSGANKIQLYLKKRPYPISGRYVVGTYTYKVFAREFDNALVLDKPLPSWQVTELGDASATTSYLPATADNPTGVYHRLNVDGTIDSTLLTRISLRNGEGVILIKASARVHFKTEE
jgi:hypothetical protein